MGRNRAQQLTAALHALAGIVIAVSLSGCAGLRAGNSGNSGSNGSGNSGGGSGNPSNVNHIIYIVEENRSFDHYLGQLGAYRKANGFPGTIDGLPAEGSSNMPTNPRVPDYAPVSSFHLKTVCIENLSASWYESHQDFNLFNPSSNTPTMDGFAWSAGGDASFEGGNDTSGTRAMGFYDGGDLPYHYFLASQFATSDRWFSPAPTETEPNKMYLVAATSAGHAHKPTSPVNVKTIFDLLNSANVSWKIYYAGRSTDPIVFYFQPFANNNLSHIVPIAEYFTDLKNGTLPSVAMIEPAFDGSDDEHPGVGANLEIGAADTKQYIDALMQSSAWKDSAFILTFDEAGGLYDHVPPPTNVPSPDGIPPKDLFMTNPPDPPGDFTRYGFRVPLIVVSPFAKKNYVSHTVTDSTAILKFIETRFNLPNLTKRDAAASDMLEFFDFSNTPWATPPSNIPEQPTTGPCYDALP